MEEFTPVKITNEQIKNAEKKFKELLKEALKEEEYKVFKREKK